jgi:hypothetical protein
VPYKYSVMRHRPTEQQLLQVELYLEFRANLRDVLATGGLVALRRLLRDAGSSRGDREMSAMASWADARLTLCRHQLILADVELRALHRSSRAWLRRHGYEIPPASMGYGRPNADREQMAQTA